MHGVHTLDGLAMLFSGLEPVRHVNAPDHQNSIVLPDFAPYVTAEPATTCTDPARLQRASEGPRQSAAG